MQKQIIVLGGLGISERRDRDIDRIIGGGGAIYTLPAHIFKGNPLTLRKYSKRELSESGKLHQMEVKRECVTTVKDV